MAEVSTTLHALSTTRRSNARCASSSLRRPTATPWCRRQPADCRHRRSEAGPAELHQRTAIDWRRLRRRQRQGLAHVGVIRWFEEHRIPIDVAAGTSMGGLIGGAFATGMNADELQAMLNGIDWDEMFGASAFKYKNIRRKEDARAYPSRLEFGVKRGIVAPPSLNNGEQVELLLARITASTYGWTASTSCRRRSACVAVDLVSASQVVLDRGSLAQAHARDDVAAADFSARRAGWPGAG